MAGRKRQLFEVLGARQNAGRTSSGGDDRVGGTAAAGVEKVVGAGRSAVAWFESVAGGKRGAGATAGPRAAAASRAKPAPAGVSAPGMPAFSLLAVAFVLLALGFGIGRWTASPADAPDETQLRRSEQGRLEQGRMGPGTDSAARAGGPRSPEWVSSYRPLQGDEYFAALAGEFYPIVVVGDDERGLRQACGIVDVLREGGLDTARIHRTLKGGSQPVLAIGAFWSGDTGELVSAVRSVDARGDRGLGQFFTEFDGTITIPVGG